MLTDLDYELLSAYIDGALTDSERIAFEIRLQAEPELRHELDELRATIRLLNNLPVLKAPRDFTLDARYGRRSSSFFTSAVFSALSTAAAVILFALGAYVLTVNQAPTSAPASSNQVGQVAIMPSATDSTLDKAAATTVTEPLANEIQAVTSSPLNSPIGSPDGGAANDAVALPTQTAQPSSPPAQAPLFQPDIAQATEVTSEGFNLGSAAAAPSDMQRRTDEATETSTSQESAETSSDGIVSGAVPAPSLAQVIPSTQAAGAEANTSMAFAATQLPFTATPLQTASPTLTPSLTLTASLTLTPSLTLTLSPTLTVSPTLTPSLTVTASPTLTRVVQPTETTAPLPTAAPFVFQPNNFPGDTAPLLLIVLGGIFLIIAVATTLIRRRNRS